MPAERKREERLSKESHSPVKEQLKCTPPCRPRHQLQKQKKQKDVMFVGKPLTLPSTETGTTAESAASHARTQNFIYRQNPAIKTETTGMIGRNHGLHLKAGVKLHPGGLSHLRLAQNNTAQA